MAAFPPHFFRKDMASLDPYAAIKPLDILAEELGFATHELAKLDANEVRGGSLLRSSCC